MKITKQQLKKIIEEELESSLGEDNMEDLNETVGPGGTGQASSVNPLGELTKNFQVMMEDAIAAAFATHLEPLKARVAALDGKGSAE